MNETIEKENILNLGRESINSLKFEEAIEFYNKCLSIDPKSAEAQFQKGYCYLKLEKVETAIEHFEKAMELDTDNSITLRYLLNMVNLYEMKDEKMKMEECKQKIWNFHPRTANDFRTLGNAYSGEKKYDLAIQNLSKAIELDPTVSRFWSNRAAARMDSGSLELALEDFDKAIELKPGRSYVHHNKGTALTKLKRYEEAIQEFNDCIKINSKHAEAHIGRGNCYMELGQLEFAKRDFLISLEIEPMGNLKEKGVFFILLGDRYRDNDAYDNAIDCYSRGIKFDSYNAAAYLNRGFCYMSKKETENAMKDFEMAAEYNPKYDKAHFNLGVCYRDLGHYKKGVAAFKKAMDLGKTNDFDLFMAMGYCYFQLKDWKNAEKCYVSALKIKPNDENAKNNLVATRENKGGCNLQ